MALHIHVPNRANAGAATIARVVLFGQTTPESGEFVKKTFSCALLLAVILSLPGYGFGQNNGPHDYKHLQKSAQKYRKDMAKQQRKEQKRQAKAQAKALKAFRKQHPQ